MCISYVGHEIVRGEWIEKQEGVHSWEKSFEYRVWCKQRNSLLTIQLKMLS